MGRAVQAGEQRNRTMKEIVRAGWQGAPLLKYTNRLMESMRAFEAGELRNRNDCVQVPSAECTNTRADENVLVDAGALR